MQTMEEVALAGAKAQADIDRYLTLARKAALRLEKVNEAGVSLGMVKPLRGKAIITQGRAATGRISDAAHAFAVLHVEQTRVCAENDCDVPPMTSAGGVTTMGGGGRG